MTASAAPRPAATLVVVRDGARGLEVLLTTRPRRFRFMGGATVFPGGAVAPADRDGRWAEVSRLTAQQAAGELALTDPTEALGYFVCALREAFEEVALPPCDRGGPCFDRSRLDADTFLEGCLAAGSDLVTDRLSYAGRWVTPADSPVRFDTRFFLTAAPDGFEPEPLPAEVDDCYWATPADALAALASGRSIMAPPTIDMLQRLERYGSAGEALRAVREGSLGASARVLCARLSASVQVVIAPNAGVMTGPGTNSYVVGSEPAWIIDPATDDPAYVDALANLAGDVTAVLVTHRHDDHTGGAAAVAHRTEAPVRAFGDRPAGGVGVHALHDGDVLAAGGVTLKALHTPGHAPDHLSFLLLEEAALFAGDNVMGEGTPVIDPPEGHMRTYLTTIRRLAQLDLERIYPGHFRPRDDVRRVWEDLLSHRAAREQSIVEALHGAALDVTEIVRRSYPDTPPELHEMAARTTLAHLQMLEEDGKVVRDGRLWRLRTR